MPNTSTEPTITLQFGVQELERILHLADEGRLTRGLPTNGAEANIVASLRSQLVAKLAR
jgi:hypothetical protein